VTQLIVVGVITWLVLGAAFAFLIGKAIKVLTS